MRNDQPSGGTPLPRIGKPATQALNYYLAVFTLEDVSKFSRKELLSLHGMGPKAIGILEQALAEHNMDFASDS